MDRQLVEFDRQLMERLKTLIRDTPPLRYEIGQLWALGP